MMGNFTSFPSFDNRRAVDESFTRPLTLSTAFLIDYFYLRGLKTLFLSTNT